MTTFQPPGPHAAAPVGPLSAHSLAGSPEGLRLPASRHVLDASMFWTVQGGGGVHRYLSAKRSLLSQRGWRHTLVAPGATGPSDVDCGGVLIPGSNGYRFVVDRRRAARLIERVSPDLIEAADPYRLGWAALDASTRLDVPAVAFCHSNLPALLAQVLGGHGARPRLAQWVSQRASRYLRHFYAHFDMVLAPSRSMMQALHAMGVTQARHQPLGVDCRVFTPQARDPAWRHAWLRGQGLAPDTKLLLYVGRFAPEKHLQVLADAVRRLGPAHVLLAVGGGPTPPRGPAVRTLPNEMDSGRLARLMASVDAFVHAGDQETFGLSVLEAMACGTPVVVSESGGLGELAGGVGWTVRGHAVDRWAQALQAGLGQSRPASVQAAWQRAQLHDWAVVLGQLERRYHRLLGAGEAPRRARGSDFALLQAR